MHLHCQQMHTLSGVNELAAEVWANENEQMQSQLVPRQYKQLGVKKWLML